MLKCAKALNIHTMEYNIHTLYDIRDTSIRLTQLMAIFIDLIEGGSEFRSLGPIYLWAKVFMFKGLLIRVDRR